MSGCGKCGGNCSSCSDCRSALELNTGEITLLRALGEIPFFPVARKANDPAPICYEDIGCSPEECSLILQCLEKKGLISIDFDIPLKGSYDAAYAPYPIRGSFALTQRGQQVLELMDTQGIDG